MTYGNFKIKLKSHCRDIQATVHPNFCTAAPPATNLTDRRTNWPFGNTHLNNPEIIFRNSLSAPIYINNINVTSPTRGYKGDFTNAVDI